MVVVKFDNDGDMRRVTLDKIPSLEETKSLLATLYRQTLPEHFSLKYKDDDGDIITIASDRELEEAFRLFQKESVVRFMIFRSTLLSESHLTTPQIPAETQKEIANETKDNEIHEAVHNAICDSCHLRIRGTRWRCRNCSDYDLCSSCNSISPHPHPMHPFARIEKRRKQPGNLDQSQIEEEKRQEGLKMEREIERKRLDEEMRVMEERQRLEEEKRRILDELMIEEERLRKMEQEKLEKAKEEMRLAQEKMIEERRLAEERRLENEKRLAEEKKLAEMRLKEEMRLAEERRMQFIREEQERAMEEEKKRRAKEEDERIQQELERNARLAEERRLMEEKRLAEEKIRSQRLETWKPHLQQLAEMGFGDANYNIDLLEKHKGDVMAVLNEILNQ